jgi:hypothetical protein
MGWVFLRGRSRRKEACWIYVGWCKTWCNV